MTPPAASELRTTPVNLPHGAHPAAHSAAHAYHPTSALGSAFTMGGQSAAFGLVAGALRNVLAGHNAGLLVPIGTFAAVGGAYAFTESMVANERESSDAVSVASGACASGFLLGLTARSLPVAVGACGLMGAAAGMAKYTNALKGRSTPKDGSFFKPTAAVEIVKSQ
ncbi:hypothetical protein MKEN_00789100 [Mycena kentingensis (nom. inval.)]|nr:hypothetical protein MKEN_00789100 [Mycena kentingensis (nom. inval.)]